jgi:photosystem II oxygen-evolving enhancer protein 1
MKGEATKKALLGGFALGAAALIGVQDASALTSSDLRSLTYQEIKGTGVANRCPEVAENTGPINVVGKTGMKDMCLEPKSFQIEEDVKARKGEAAKKQFVDTKLMTRATYSLSGVEGILDGSGDGIKFTEKGGIDYAPATVQLPGGERVPFMFTIKELVAQSGSSEMKAGTTFSGNFKVPSYRSGLFLDPKGRGGTTGYDMAQGLPGMEADGGEGQEELRAETNKVFQVTEGSIEFAVTKADQQTGEWSGVFVSEQLSDTDMGSKAPKKVLLKGTIFGRVAGFDGTEEYKTN